MAEKFFYECGCMVQGDQDFFCEKHRLKPPSAGEETPRSSLRETPKCVIGEYCAHHGFVHGGEAEELRQRIEHLIHQSRCSANGLQNAMRFMLDDVDARDSCAFREAQDRVSASLREQEKDDRS